MRKTATARFAIVAAATSLVLVGCAPSAPGTNSAATTAPVTQAQIDKAMNTPTTITFWSWVPDIQHQVDLFEKKYPKITVKYSNVGRGQVAYQKERAALKAGSGFPDVTHMEYQYTTSFQNQLMDLTPYGGAALEKDFSPSIWKQVVRDGKVLGMPLDDAPMTNLYRQDVLDKAGVKPPTTWDEYATAAQTVKDKTGNYISDIGSNDAGQIVGLFWQAGARPFAYDGNKTVKIDLAGTQEKKVTDYWNNLIQKGLVDTKPDFTDDWFSNLNSGKYAGWVAASWSPDILRTSAADGAGKWRASALPQWDASNPQSALWGGSSNAVFKGSKNPIVAAEFVKFIGTDKEATYKFATEQGLYPTTVQTINNPSFADQKYKFFGDQQTNKLFGQLSTTVKPDFQWLPFMDFVYSSFNDTLGKAMANKTDLTAGLQAWQDQTVAYAKSQGYTVQAN